MILGHHHIGISTPDVRRLCLFYGDLFGFETVFEGTLEPGNAQLDRMVGLQNVSVHVIMMRTETAFLELIQPLPPIVPAARPLRASSLDYGYGHMCFHVSDLDAEHARLEAKGMAFTTPPAMVGMPVKVVYGTDPDGNCIELIEVLDAEWPFHFDKRHLQSRQPGDRSPQGS